MDRDELARRRLRLLEDIAQDYAETEPWTGRSAMASAVRAALAAVERHRCLPPDMADLAYVNRAVPIGHGQTISQPYMVAIMTDLLEVAADHKVLEIGTGSAYQAAVLSRLADRVFTIEAIPALARQAWVRLAELGCGNVELRQGDGWLGWPEEAPFDRIIVTAAPEELPRRLVDQLRPGGRMVLPIGPVHRHQALYVCDKDAQGNVRLRETLPVAFVPMVKHPAASPDG